jgi:hypothetical protein
MSTAIAEEGAFRKRSVAVKTIGQQPQTAVLAESSFAAILSFTVRAGL